MSIMQRIGLPIFISLLMVSGMSYGAEKFYPRGCKDNSVTFSGDYVYLGTEPSSHKYRVYVLNNISHSQILMDHPPPPNTQSNNGLATNLEANTWSAILVDKDHFELTCKEDYAGELVKVPCSEVVRACELAVSPVMLSSRGLYWITTNRGSKSSLFSGIREQGIYP